MLVEAYFAHREDLQRFVAARLGRSGQDVEDVLQDLYLKATGIGPEVDVRDPRAFLYRLASNLMMDRWRSGRRAAARDGAWRRVAAGDGTDGEADDAPSAEAVVAARQRLARLTAEVDRLPEKTRRIFRMHKFEGLSYAETAAALGVSKSSVEKHMMEALRRLAKAAGQ
ncbi:RNA polymerase sigma factor [Brevundimonas sp. SORGH_AS_0993]|uniref:RNA polymerase sigma factor n=1 Tax=Brevundimonas sp. SORGH_AS_0993 TaxID=3041794 RepID=UPI002782BF69|nr:RNA polymerase sigma factor [Brevundimonas sp. SORGH_AS_0993]MDQ1153658.1 RNA polymerase sigma factor (sigma-70 family) [Brevundimonas sp. SORGH_AS_0993]